MSAAASPEFIRFVAETYKDDLTGESLGLSQRVGGLLVTDLRLSLVGSATCSCANS